jgi:hypothetical protein
MAAGRARAVSAFGWGHFATYATVVVIVAPLGLDAVAIGAACVHTAFLLVGYRLLVGGPAARALRALWRDIAPAVLASAGLAGAGLPLSLALQAWGIPTLPYLLAVCAAGLASYAVTLWWLYPDALRATGTLALRVLPRPRRFLPSWRGSSQTALPFYR